MAKKKKTVAQTNAKAKKSPKLSSKKGPSKSAKCKFSKAKAIGDYKKKNSSLHKKLVDPNVSKSKKRKISETLGEEAAIAMDGVRKKRKTERKDYQIFDGRDVVDLYDEKEGVILEAKGGKSQYGTRKDARRKSDEKISAEDRRGNPGGKFRIDIGVYRRRNRRPARSR